MSDPDGIEMEWRDISNLISWLSQIFFYKE